MGAVRKVPGLDPGLVERAEAVGVEVTSGDPVAILAEVERWENASLEDRIRRSMELWNEWEKGKLLPSDEFNLY